MAGIGQGNDLASTMMLLTSLKHLQLALRCRDRQWQVHESILREHSFFRILLDEVSKIGRGNFVELDDGDDPEAVTRMVIWMYTKDYYDAPGIETVNEPAYNPQRPAGPSTQAEDSPSGIQGESHPANSRVMQPHLARTLLNIDMYCLAEKYDLGGLQDLAAEKCLAESWATWTVDELSVLVKKLYPAPTRSCRALRKKLVQACAEKLPGFFVKADGTCAIADAGNFATDLSQEVQIRECEKQIENLETKLLFSGHDNLHLHMALTQARIERDEAVKHLNMAIKSTIDIDECQDCGASFGGMMGFQSLPGLPLPLVCKRCHATH